jgi:CheY-like chemotaxis protein/anti-sigma regulatory factor (Ser/Thr protein kinase)
VGLVKDKPVTLEQHVPDDLPPIWADSTRVRQIVLNLISNATKFTEQGKVTLTASYDDEWVTVSVADTGIGIPNGRLTHIFEEFTQVDASTTRRAGGTGLGLPISRHFVAMHGGEIRVESEEGVGSVFTFTLPIHPRPESVGQPAGAEGEEEIPDIGGQVVLAVDDDADVISLYRRYLEGEGYRVIGLTSSDDVVEKAKELSPYAITLDVLMPGKDGWQVLRELKACPQTRDIPIVVCSIVSEEGRGFSLGAADYLVKPIMESELLAALARLDHVKGERMEVLVIDDRADDILLIRRVLEAQGDYRVIEASGGRSGIDLVRRRRPDVIILDLMMPDLDGFGVLEALKREPETRTIPVIVVTAKELSEEERRRLNGQVEVLLRKGLFTERELLEDVREVLKRVQAHRSDHVAS